MTTLNENKVKKFREKLYQKRVSKLLQKGGKGLNPLERYKNDEKGRPLVTTDKIIRFFSKEMEKVGDRHPDQYFISLFTLLRILTKGAEPFSYECGFSVSEKDIHESDNKTTIEQLTKNLIITYFSNLKDYKGRVDTELLTPDLKIIIQKSNAGRDYRTLVGNTLKKLVASLAEDKPWREYLEDINDADLVCRLTGAKLPSMDKKVLTGIILKSRKEIQQYTLLFNKVLNTREQMAAEEKNDKKYLKAMQRLDEATQAILGKIDGYLTSAHSFMKIIGLTPEVLMGKIDTELKLNLTRLFLGVRPDEASPDILAEMGYATARYRLSMLFDYPEITVYCRAFKADTDYQGLYLDLFRLLYRELVEKMDRLGLDTDETGIRLLKQSLFETHRAVEKLALEEDFLLPEKETVRSAFVTLIREVPFDRLGGVMELTEPVCRVTQDQPREIMAHIRSALLESCFATLSGYAEKSMAADKAKNGIKKRLHYYAMYYKPQRAFYQLFFNRYIGKSGGGISSQLSDFQQKNKHFVFALFMLFSDKKAMKDLITKEMIEHATSVLAALRKKQ